MTAYWFPCPWWRTYREAIIVLSARESVRSGMRFFRRIVIPYGAFSVPFGD